MELVCDVEMFWIIVFVVLFLFLICKVNYKLVILYINIFIILFICWIEFVKRIEDVVIKVGGYLEEEKSN